MGESDSKIWTDEQLLTTEDMETYRLIAAGDELPVQARVDRLLELGLVTADPYMAGHYIAADPRAAAQRLMVQAQADLKRTVARIAQVPTLETLGQHFDPHRWYGGPGSEFLPSREQMNARIGEVSTGAATEVYTAQPGAPADRDPEIVRLGISRTLETLEAGAEVRSLYNTVAAGHAQTRDQVAEIAKGGAQVRALSGLFPRMLLIDGSHLFIDNHVVQSAESDSGWHVSDRAAVMWARAVFQMLWRTGIRWEELSQTRESILTERQKAILTELAAGLAQQDVGPLLGLSDRTVAKDLTAVKARLGATTLYQVMAWWGRAADGADS